MIKNAWAVWKGGIKDGGGNISTETGVLKEAPYGFNARFENGKGTNPEELIGAAHAGCFSMALSGDLSKAGYTVDEIKTEAIVSMEKGEAGFGITGVKLVTKARVRDIEMAEFAKIASGAKQNCPVSRALAAVDIQLEAHLLK
jgi:osmotically inducible protein OsmC